MSKAEMLAWVILGFMSLRLIYRVFVFFDSKKEEEQ